MGPQKIPLQAPKIGTWIPPGWKIIPLLSALPYYQSRRGRYVHIVRSGAWHGGKEKPFSSFTMWCGALGYSGRGVLSASADGHVLCATCEGRAVGVGIYGERTINGRAVMFTPNTKAMSDGNC